MRRPHATPLLAVLLLALSAPSGAAEVELEFEWKLRYRPRFSFLPGAVDQWAGARLALDREGSTLALRAPLEHPWVLRWYPGKDELKLGTTVTVAVDETAGHPYAALAPEAARRAAARERAWRDDPFFRDCRERAGETPRLSPDPVYPFWALGDPAGRLAFRLLPGGEAVDVRERLSEPWLPDGWAAARRGEAREGTGYWEAERPDWEPRLYPAIAAALGALGERVPLAAVAAVAETLNPRARGRLDWGDATLPPGGPFPVDGGRYRARVERTASPAPHGSAQGAAPGAQRVRVRIESARDPCALRVELTVGYRPDEVSKRSPALPSGG